MLSSRWVESQKILPMSEGKLAFISMNRRSMKKYTSIPAVIPAVREHVKAAAEWLGRSQDATGCGGSAAYWAPFIGWAEPYPETSGYIAPTLWRCDDVLPGAGYAERARRMVDWLVSIQSDEGWFPGGKWKPGVEGTPSVFNTAQILFGLVEAALRTGEDRYRDAAEKAAAWLVGSQQADGQWSIGHYREGYQPSYYAHVCWPLALYWTTFGDDKTEHAVRRALDVVLSTRTEKGSFTNWAFAPGKPAFTHTIAYTIQGLLESSFLLDAWEPYGQVACDSAERLMRYYEIRHRLAGAYDLDWKGVGWYRCLTGHCQLASTWLHLYQSNEDARFLNAAVRALEEVSRLQRLNAGSDGVRGGIAGSSPLYGRYMMFRYPNWAAKFFIDAMLDLEIVLAQLESPADVWPREGGQ